LIHLDISLKKFFFIK